MSKSRNEVIAEMEAMSDVELHQYWKKLSTQAQLAWALLRIRGWFG